MEGMKVHAECGPCLLKRVLFQSQIGGDPDAIGTMRLAMGKYAEIFDCDICSAYAATEVHRVSYDRVGKDMYAGLKKDADAA